MDFSVVWVFLVIECGGGMNDYDDDDEVDEFEEDDEEIEEFGFIRKKKKKKRGKNKVNGYNMGWYGINSDEVGDVCDCESDVMELDGFDDGEDFIGFIVLDN